MNILHQVKLAGGSASLTFTTMGGKFKAKLEVELGAPSSTSSGLSPPLHYGIRAMGAMTLRISDLCLSFSPHPNISDGNFTLVHQFFAGKYFR